MLDIAVHLKDNRHIDYLWTQTQAQVARHWHLLQLSQPRAHGIRVLYCIY